MAGDLAGLRLLRVGPREGHTDFPLFFGPAMDRLRAYAWLLHDVMFSLPPDWDGDENARADFDADIL